MKSANDHRAGATAVAFVLTLVCTATAQYSGGTGEPNDPYQIATAADLILLGESLEDYDRHFVLTADIDLDPNLPGGKTFDRAVIAPDPDRMDPNLPGAPFVGVFDGNGHTLSHLTVHGRSYLGLFGQLASGAQVRGLGIVDANITGGYYVGGVVGHNRGAVVACHATGSVRGTTAAPFTGGLVGSNDGQLSRCYSAGTVVGTQTVGGLAGTNNGTVTQCYSTGMVRGSAGVGGLVGSNSGSMVYCYSTSTVSGTKRVGGLVGQTEGGLTQCYSAGTVTGTSDVGGLVGSANGRVTGCFWDIQSSGQATSALGTGKTTAEMQDIRTYQDAGWDWVDTIEDGTAQIWQMPPEAGYPVLAIFHGYTPPQLPGDGTSQNPYLIADARELGAVVHYGPCAHYRLAASIDLAGIRWGAPVLPSFGGTFDGNTLTIAHLTIEEGDYTGLFGHLVPGAEVRDLGVVDVNVAGSGSFIGGLAGENRAVVTRCFSSGAVRGRWSVGGVVGSNRNGTVTRCRSSATVTAPTGAGGLVGQNNDGTITACCSTGVVTSSQYAGGLVGFNAGAVTACCSAGAVFTDSSAGGLAGLNTGTITNSYATGEVIGTDTVGGLVGENVDPGCHAGTISNCYASGVVWGDSRLGGLVGSNVCEKTAEQGVVTHCFWDTWTSGRAESSGGTGRTKPEMQTAATFLDAGWDFIGETANGTEDIWLINEGRDYPRLWWEVAEE